MATRRQPAEGQSLFFKVIFLQAAVLSGWDMHWCEFWLFGPAAMPPKAQAENSSGWNFGMILYHHDNRSERHHPVEIDMGLRLPIPE
jgi:hypothetical protein